MDFFLVPADEPAPVDWVSAEDAEMKRVCKEAHGDHDWELELELDDDIGGPAQLGCTRCPAGIDDVYPDGFDMIFLDLGPVQVESGRHNSAVPLTVPVNVSVWTGQYWTSCGYEYDAEVIMSQRGPVREDPV